MIPLQLKNVNEKVKVSLLGLRRGILFLTWRCRTNELKSVLVFAVSSLFVFPISCRFRAKLSAIRYPSFKFYYPALIILVPTLAAFVGCRDTGADQYPLSYLLAGVRIAISEAVKKKEE